jgi:hypothetical protein
MIGGIDPGMSGAISFISEDWSLVECKNIPLKYVKDRIYISKRGKDKGKKKTSPVYDYNYYAIKKMFDGFNLPIRKVYIELQRSMPDQSSAANGKLMRGYGFLIGLVVGLGLKFSLVDPKTWKNSFNLKSDKKKSIELAQELSGYDFIPEGKKSPSDGMAESYLIARYGNQREKNLREIGCKK